MVNELTLTAEYGCNTCVDMFIKMGVDVNKADSVNNTALVMAATYGFAETVNLLIKVQKKSHLLPAFKNIKLN